MLESRSRVAKDGNTGAANLVEDSEECGNTAVAEAAEGTIKEDIAVREEEEAITCSRPKSPVTKHPTPSRESLTLKQNPKREGNKNQETPSFKITAETNKFLRKNTAPTHRCHTKNPETKVRTQTRARERERDRGVREEGSVEISWRRRAALRKITFFIQEANRIMDG